MDNFVHAHTYLAAQHAWWTLKAGFIFLCVIGAAMFALWVAGAILGSYIEARQLKRRTFNYRVGGSINP